MTGWGTERQIRRVLRNLSKQRIAHILPGNVWVVEWAVSRDDPKVRSALHTCSLRGWVDVLENAVPTGSVEGFLGAEGSRAPFTSSEPIYRITDSGWAVINRSQAWAVSAVILAAASFLVALVVAYLQVRGVQ